MQTFSINSIQRSINTGLRILCFLILATICLALLLPFLFHNDLRVFQRVMEDGQAVEHLSKKYAVMVDQSQVHSVTKSNYLFANLPKQEVIAVIADSGVDINHPALQPFLWTNPWEIENGIDDDGNGCVDDIHGCYFGHFSNNGNVEDTVGHGTHVAGIIAGVPDSSIKLPGQDAKVRFVVAKCLPQKYYALTCPAAVDYAVWIHQATGLPVVLNASLSWLVDPLGSWEAAVARAQKAGVLIVASAGNTQGGYMHYPANLSLEYDNVISVAAINDVGGWEGFSSKYADIGAPGGSEIESTVIGGGTGKMCGTSMAAPNVTQVALLLYKLYPNASPKEIKKLIFDGSDKRVDLENVIKEGRVLNAKWAIQPLKAFLSYDPAP